MKRKGWHRKKRRLRHDYKAQVRNTLGNHFRREAAEMFEDESADFWAKKLAMAINNQKREEVNAMGCKTKGKGGKRP